MMIQLEKLHGKDHPVWPKESLSYSARTGESDCTATTRPMFAGQSLDNAYVSFIHSPTLQVSLSRPGESFLLEQVSNTFSSAPKSSQVERFVKKQLKISMMSITMLRFEILKRYAETKEAINRRDGRHFTLPSALAVHKATTARCELYLDIFL